MPVVGRRPRKGILARHPAWSGSHHRQLPETAPTVDSSSGSSAEPASPLRRRARVALAPVRRVDVAEHLLHVHAAPLPGRAAALLACHCCTHLSFLSSIGAPMRSVVFLADDLRHLQVDGEEPPELGDQARAGPKGLGRRERCTGDVVSGVVHRPLLSYSGIRCQPGRALAL